MSLTIPTMCALRFSTGIRPGEALPQGPEDLLAQLATGAGRITLLDAGLRAERHAKLDEIAAITRKAGRLKKKGDKAGAKKLAKKFRSKVKRTFAADQHRRFIEAVTSPLGFYERIVSFWVNHFSVNARKRLPNRVWTPLMEAEAIRPNVAGPFATLLKAAVLHPAMLLYLDQNRSAGPNSPLAGKGKNGFNENLGRELLELHTLGVDGGYSQEDVRNAALLLTGLDVKRGDRGTMFNPGLAESGIFPILGRNFGADRRSMDDIVALLDWLALRPETARHLSRKLAIHFIADDPPAGLVEAMTKAYLDSGGDLTAQARAMLEHPAAWQDFGAKARQPFDFLVAGLRALNVPAADLAMARPNRDEEDDEPDDLLDELIGDDPAMMAEEPAKGEEPNMAAPVGSRPRDRRANPLSVGAAQLLGQPVWQPPSPAGWEEGADVWISSAQVTGRIGWARLVAGRYGTATDPRELVKLVLADAARDDTIRIVGQAPSRVAGTSFILASPEFNRR